MKRKYLILCIILFLFTSCFAKSKKTGTSVAPHLSNFEPINENKSIITYILNKNVEQNGNMIKKGTLVYQNKNDSFFSYDESFHIFCNVKELNNIYDFNSDDLDIVNEKYEIPSFLYKTKWINKYYFDYVYNQNDDFIAKYEPYIKNLTEIDYKSEVEENWAMTYFNLIGFSFYKNGFITSSRFQNDGIKALFYIKSDIHNVITLSILKIAETNRKICEDYYPLWEKDVPYDLIFVHDGDFLNIYFDSIKDSNLLYELAKVDKKSSEEIEKFCQRNNLFKTPIEYDLSKITWPHHADGSCDYDGSKTTVSPQTANSTSSTNVVKNKTMAVSENLKLRSGEATSTQVLTVMSAGTKVKILELGKAETIDGISSNWVKVEVQTAAKDREGKPIKSGTVGWCYGGFLE